MNEIVSFEDISKTDVPTAYIRENTWLTRAGSSSDFLNIGLDFGWGNGYVAIPEGHPWYESGYSELESVDINGGLTFSEKVGDMWVIGFDTAHSFDSLAAWPKEMIWNEALKLLEQVNNVK